jgi:hypothetical protein
MNNDTPIPPVIQIPLTRGQIAIIDSVDADLALHKWFAASDCKTYYAKRAKRINGKQIAERLHRVVLERMLNRPLEKGEIVDHINRNGLDNRRDNLRLASRADNTRNVSVRTDSTSQYKGVRRNWKKWKACIKYNGQDIYLGSFADILDAARAYNEAAIKYYGEFAYLNPIPE